MVRYQVILAYDGTAFLGFQRQSEGRTVQQVVEDALRALGWQGQSILAAGRTDTGVHASGQVIAFDLDWRHSLEDLRNALNDRLPADVAVRSAKATNAGFHPRYDAYARRYRYRIYCERVRDPLRDRYAWRVWPAVNLSELQAAAERIVGTFDFAAFGTPPQADGSSVRTILQASWKADGLGLLFEILSEAFLYHMVRRLVYFQVSIAQGKAKLAELDCLLRSGGQDKQPLIHGLAPPCGLELVEVCYLPHIIDEPGV
jgi:tRNA pseudouridine38-40 synthase